MSAVISRRVSSRGVEEPANDPDAYGLLRLLDGRRDLARAARESGLDIRKVIKVITKLCQMKLAEPAGVNPRSKKHVDGQFFAQLTANYSRAVGPIAHVMIEDTVADLGYGSSRTTILA